MKGLWKNLSAAKASASISLTDLTCSPHTLNPLTHTLTSPIPLPTPTAMKNSSRVDLLWWVSGSGEESE